MRKSIQSDELFKAYVSSKRSFEDIMRYIQSDPDKDIFWIIIWYIVLVASTFTQIYTKTCLFPEEHQ